MRSKLAFLLLGALIGAVLAGMLSSSRLEQVYWEKEKLKVQLFEITERLHKVEKQWATYQEGQVRDVIIELQTEAGPFIELALHQALNEITSDLVGERISDLNPDLLISLLHQRILNVEKKDYRVNVNWMIIGEAIKFNLTASLVAG